MAEQFTRQMQQLPALFEQFGKVQRYSRGESIYIQEYEAEAFYMVKSGTLRSYVMGSSGKEITLEILGPGKFFGFVSFFWGIGRLASVVALSEAEVLVLNHDTVRRCFGEHYELAVEVIQALGMTTQFLVSQVENLIIPSAEQRLAHTLLQLIPDFPKKESDLYYRIPCTHQQLAELAGMNRVTTTKELNRFAKYGWIGLGYGEVLIKNREALRACII